MTGEGPPDTAPEELLEHILEEKRRGQDPDFEAIARRHPEFAEELKELLPAMELLVKGGAPAKRGSRSTSGERSLQKRLASRFGREVDPGIVLEQEREHGTAAVSEALTRIAGHSGRYEFRSEIGRGGQGAVLAVWDGDLRRNLAMKVLLEQGSKGPTPEGRTLGRFLEEAQVTAQLDHPGIVPVHELGLDSEARVYFTMKLVRGRDLRAIFELVQRGEEGWTLTRALNVLLKVCEAMAYAHAKGVIHRDLKPSNVMVGRYGEVYVMDWGLARVAGREDRKDIRIRPALAPGELPSERGEASLDLDSPLVTMQGDVVGTPAYMSPEQAHGDLAAMGPRSDVYSLGALLYHLLAGQMPYVRADTRLTSPAIWALVQQGPPDPVQALAPDAPVELAAICEKAMSRDPGLRYADMGALAEDLRAFLENRVVAAHRTGVLVELRKWVGRNRGLAAASAAAIVLALGGLSAVGYVQARGKKAVDAQRANVMRLSAFQELAELERLADELWPPWPERDQAYRDWMRRAEKLVSGLEPDPGGDDTGHRARLAELEARALPYADEDREADRRSHPRFPELGRLQARIAALEKADAVRTGEARLDEFELDASVQSLDASSLNELAWARVDPARSEWDELPGALALARAANARNVPNASDRANFLDTLAWALVINGLDDEALAASNRALQEAPDDRKAEFRTYLDRVREEIEAARSGTTLAHTTEEVLALESELDRRLTWRFANEEDRWWHSQLVDLIRKIEGFADPETGLIDGFSPAHGSGVARRLALSESIADQTVGGAGARKWSEALASISNTGECPAYGGLVIEPQLGLLPIGRDPESGLWEFAHIQTGEPAERGPDGKLVVEEDTGMVFVLLPGGTFRMGAQSVAPDAPNYDPQAEVAEAPVHLVTLSPFFLSKYEMTQGQWLRTKGSNPSHAGPHFWQARWSRSGAPADLTHPVECVGWLDCVRTCARVGCVLPSEARWEYAARAGTTTVWWTGNEVESLQDAANVADLFAKNVAGDVWNGNDESLDDGFVWHAPVASFRPNPFGLHNVHGNVGEFCLDRMNGASFYMSCQIDPVVDPVELVGVPGTCSGRGGTYWDRAVFARSAKRDWGTVGEGPGPMWVGLRPACEIRGAIRYAPAGESDR